MAIITPAEARTLARPMSNAVADDKLAAYIEEVEQTQIKPALGDALFIAVSQQGETPAPPYDVLINGGNYGNDTATIAGLKKAIAYAVDCKMIQSGDLEVTRYGVMEYRGEYSDHSSDRRISNIANELAEIATRYRNECLQYCKAVGLTACGCKAAKRNGIFGGGLKIRKIQNH